MTLGPVDTVALVFVVVAVTYYIRRRPGPFRDLLEMTDRLLPRPLFLAATFHVRVLLPAEQTSPPVFTDLRAEYNLPNEHHWPMDER